MVILLKPIVVHRIAFYLWYFRGIKAYIGWCNYSWSSNFNQEMINNSRHVLYVFFLNKINYLTTCNCSSLQLWIMWSHIASITICAPFVRCGNLSWHTSTVHTHESDVVEALTSTLTTSVDTFAEFRKQSIYEENLFQASQDAPLYQWETKWDGELCCCSRCKRFYYSNNQFHKHKQTSLFSSSRCFWSNEHYRRWIYQRNPVKVL